MLIFDQVALTFVVVPGRRVLMTIEGIYNKSLCLKITEIDSAGVVDVHEQIHGVIDRRLGIEGAAH